MSLLPFLLTTADHTSTLSPLSFFLLFLPYIVCSLLPCLLMTPSPSSFLLYPSTAIHGFRLCTHVYTHRHKDVNFFSHSQYL